MTQDDRRDYEQLFGSRGWELLLHDAQDQLDRLERYALDAPSWEAIQYNRGCRDTLRTLLAYERILEAADEPPDADTF